MTPPAIPFDLQRMLIGDESLLFFLEIFVRTSLIFAYMLFAVRFIGKRGMGQMTPFELIIVILLGAAGGDAMFYPEVPLLHSFFVITTVVLLEKILNYYTNCCKKIEEIVEGKATLLVKNGVINDQALKEEELSKDEVLMALRLKEIRYLEEVEFAYLELNGEISIFRCEEKKISSGTSTLPEEE